jgi:alcohol dehydrogenase
MFLSDKGVAATEIFASVSNILKENKITFDVFTAIDPDPKDKNVEEAFQLYKAKQPPVLLALGGGSTMDVGKAIGILATNGGRIHDYPGVDKFSNPPLPLIAIPTTAGTGSEVSHSCVITDTKRGLKMSVHSVSLNRAKVAILDPLALRSLPATVAAHAGMDAFVHALESYVALAANPITEAVTLHAMELIAENIRPFVSNRNNLDAGLQMLYGANLAAMGFSNTGVGNIHCMARFVGAYFHISHGLSNAICLPYGAEFNVIANPEKYARVAFAMGEDIDGLTPMEAGRKAIEAMKQMNRDVGIPERLREIGLTEDKIPELAQLCVEADYNRWNPRHTTYEDFVELWKKAY